MAYVAIADRDDAHALHDPQTFLTKYIWSQDHKVIAIQYGVVAVAIGLVALVMSVMMRLQLGFPNTFSFIQPQNYLQFITMHGMIMVIYLLTALFLGGFGNFLIPLMCGSRDMVFPYMNMLSFWFYLLAVLILVVGMFVPGGSTGAGWTLYPPQAISAGTPGVGWGIICMLASLAVFIVAFTMGGLNYVTTVLQARCRGMTLMRMPLSVWGIFSASILGLLAFPALFVSAIMMTLDALLGTSFFMPAVASLGEPVKHSGGSPILFQHLFWFFGHPEVYIVALPAFGVVSDLLSTHARKNIFGYRMMVWAILAIACLSFVVWAHHMYVSGMNPYFGFFFATTTLIIAVPTAIKVYNWVLTLWRGNIHLNVPMLFAMGFIFTFINGGLTGLFLGNVTVDVPLSGTYFVVAHFHMVMGVSPIMVVFGAIYHWYPKMTGKFLDEGMGKIHFWCTFLGTYAIYLPMHYLGIMGVPRRYYAYSNSIEFIPLSVQEANKWITISACFVAAIQLIFLFNLVWSYFKGKPSGGNPWRATSLEWQTEHTPATHGNWGEKLPVVYRWAYDYSVPGAPEDFIPQNVPPSDRHPGRTRWWASLMNLTVAYGALLTGVLVWLFLVRKLSAKPWDSHAAISARDAHAEGTERTPPTKMGLWVFMGVMTSLFGLFISAYYMRMGHGHGADAALGDWRAVSESPLLWVNSILLVLGSIAMQWSRSAAARGDARRTRIALLVGGLLTICFLIGQYIVWRALHRSEFFSLLNPAVAFFYVLTAVHGLHLLGGLYVWGRTYARMRYQRVELIDVRLSIELCSVYFHYLLLVWIVLFGLLLAT